MEADFRRYYGLDLAETIWADEWPPSKIAGHLRQLPEDSATAVAQGGGYPHTSLHELLAQIRDRLDVMAHQMKLSGKPKSYPRPGAPSESEAVDLSNPEHKGSIARFFGVHR